MIISHKYRFVFLSKPKCFSTSIRRALEPYSNYVGYSDKQKFHPHSTALEVKEIFHRKKWDWNNYFKFTFCREPKSLLLSHYHYGKPDEQGRSFYMPGYSGSFQMKFENWFWDAEVYDRNKKQMTTDKSVLSIKNFAFDGESQLTDRIYKFSDLKKFEADLGQRVGSVVQVEHFNPSKNKKEQKFTPEMEKQLNDWFQVETLLFS